MSCVYLKGESNITEMVDKEVLKNMIFTSKDLSLIEGGQLENKFFFSRGYSESFRNYAYYPTVHHFLKYLKSLPEQQRTLFEVVRSEAPCKVHFDLENSKYISDDSKAFDVITTFCNDFSKYIQMISDFIVEFEDYRITCSSGLKTKDKKESHINSYHVVLHDIFIMQNNHQYMKQLVTDFLSYYEKKKPIWYKWVDTSIYKHNGEMRCIYCKKPKEDNRVFTKIGDYSDEDYFITNVNTELESLDIPLDQNISLKPELRDIRMEKKNTVELLENYAKEDNCQKYIDWKYENIMVYSFPLQQVMINLANSNVYNMTVVCILTYFSIDMFETNINNVIDDNGKTILRIYADHGNQNAVDTILKQGGDPYKGDNAGITPIKMYPNLIKKSMMLFSEYVKFNRYNGEFYRDASQWLEENNIQTQSQLYKFIDKIENSRDAYNWVEYCCIAYSIVRRYNMHRLGVIMIRVVPMMLLWRKRATERLYHPTRMNFQLTDMA